MHELDISALMPEPQGSGEASEESGVNIKNPENSPAIAQGSTTLEPLAGGIIWGCSWCCGSSTPAIWA
jgi:hypothetical protein